MVCNRIKVLRKSLGLTQEEFAKRLNISRNTVATYEVGKSNPSDAAITLICRTFNINEKWLRTGEGDMHGKNEKSEGNIPAPADDGRAPLLLKLAMAYDLNGTELKFLVKYLSAPIEWRIRVANLLAGRPLNTGLA